MVYSVPKTTFIARPLPIGGEQHHNQIINYTFQKKQLMDKKISALIITILICIHSFSGCSSNQINQNKIESQKIDSLIKMHKVNDRTVMVNFGYDAVTAIKTIHGIVLVDAGISTVLTDKYRKTIEDVFHQNN